MLFRILSTQKTQCMGAIRFGHSVARSHSREMVVEFVNLSSNNREMDWRFLLNHIKVYMARSQMQVIQVLKNK